MFIGKPLYIKSLKSLYKALKKKFAQEGVWAWALFLFCQKFLLALLHNITWYSTKYLDYYGSIQMWTVLKQAMTKYYSQQGSKKWVWNLHIANDFRKCKYFQVQCRASLPFAFPKSKKYTWILSKWALNFKIRFLTVFQWVKHKLGKLFSWKELKI